MRSFLIWDIFEHSVKNFSYSLHFHGFSPTLLEICWVSVISKNRTEIYLLLVFKSWKFEIFTHHLFSIIHIFCSAYFCPFFTFGAFYLPLQDEWACPPERGLLFRSSFPLREERGFLFFSPFSFPYFAFWHVMLSLRLSPIRGNNWFFSYLIFIFQIF